jgi:hypothetical protein
MPGPQWTKWFAITAAAVPMLMVSAGTLAIPIAHTDPGDEIRTSVGSVRAGSPCPYLNSNPLLDRNAAYLVRNRDHHLDSVAPVPIPDIAGYRGTMGETYGWGDPAQQAIDRAVTWNAGAIKDCKFTDLGVAFVRDGDLDFVQVILGEPPPPVPVYEPPHQQSPGVLPGGALRGGALPPPPLPLPIPSGAPEPIVSPQPPTNPPPPPTPTATVTSDVDLYDVPGGNGNIIGMLRQGQVIKVVKACPSEDWCDLTDPKGSAWGSFLKNN